MNNPTPIQETAPQSKKLPLIAIVGVSLVIGGALGYGMQLPATSKQESEMQNVGQDVQPSPATIQTQEQKDAQLSGNESFYATVTKALLSSSTDEKTNNRTYHSSLGFTVTHPTSWIMLPGRDEDKPSYFSIHNPGGFLAYAEVDHDKKNDMKVEVYIYDRTKDKDIPATVDEWVGPDTKPGRISTKDITIDGKKAILVRSKITYDELVSSQEAASVSLIDGNRAVHFNLFTFSKPKPDPTDEKVFLDIVQSFRFTNSSN